MSGFLPPKRRFQLVEDAGSDALALPAIAGTVVAFYDMRASTLGMSDGDVTTVAAHPDAQLQTALTVPAHAAAPSWDTSENAIFFDGNEGLISLGTAAAGTFEFMTNDATPQFQLYAFFKSALDTGLKSFFATAWLSTDTGIRWWTQQNGAYQQFEVYNDNGDCAESTTSLGSGTSAYRTIGTRVDGTGTINNIDWIVNNSVVDQDSHTFAAADSQAHNYDANWGCRPQGSANELHGHLRGIMVVNGSDSGDPAIVDAWASANAFRE